VRTGVIIRVVPDMTFKSAWSRTWPDIETHPAGSGFGENLFWGHTAICLMNLMASTVLLAAIKRQGTSVLPLLRQCLRQVFDEICRTAK